LKRAVPKTQRRKNMPLKFRYKNKEEVPAEFLSLYAEREGAWQLDVDGVADKAKLDEFRQSNIALLKQLDEQKKRFEGIDPDEVRKLSDEKRKLEEERQLKAGEVEKVVENRIKGLKTDWEKQVAGLISERDALTGRLTAIQIDQGVLTAATRRGLRPTAIADITARARQVFKLVNGAPRAFDGDGQTARYGRDGVTPMTLEEWVDTQVSDAPHLFESNAGSGATGNGSGGAGNRSVKNPFRKESWNLTEQMRLQKCDPGLAARLRAAT
jgi:hypothetical protein